MSNLHLLNTQVSTITMPTGFMLKTGIPRSVTEIGYRSVTDFLERLNDKKHEGLRTIINREKSPITVFKDYGLNTQELMSSSQVLNKQPDVLNSVLADVVARSNEDLKRPSDLFDTPLTFKGTPKQQDNVFSNNSDTSDLDRLQSIFNSGPVEPVDVLPDGKDLVNLKVSSEVDKILDDVVTLDVTVDVVGGSEKTVDLFSNLEKEVTDVIASSMPADLQLPEESELPIVSDEDEIDYESKTKSELESMAVMQKVSFNSRTTKAQLIEALKGKK